MLAVKLTFWLLSPHMKLCRFVNQNQIRVGLLNDGGTISDLSAADRKQPLPGQNLFATICA